MHKHWQCIKSGNNYYLGCIRQTCCFKPQLSADYLSISCPPSIITDCTPFIISAHLNPPLIRSWATNQTNVTIDASYRVVWQKLLLSIAVKSLHNKFIADLAAQEQSILQEVYVEIITSAQKYYTLIFQPCNTELLVKISSPDPEYSEEEASITFSVQRCNEVVTF